MKRIGATLIIFLIAVALVGCGGSSTQGAKACWTKATTHAEVTQFAGTDAISKALRGLLVTSVNAQAAGVSLPSGLPENVKSWLEQTKQKCGSLK